MNDWRTDWADWRDSGALVEIELKDVMRTGVLEANDFFFNGEDEVPIFTVRLDTGEIVSFADVQRWRLTTD